MNAAGIGAVVPASLTARSRARFRFVRRFPKLHFGSGGCGLFTAHWGLGSPTLRSGIGRAFGGRWLTAVPLFRCGSPLTVSVLRR